MQLIISLEILRKSWLGKMVVRQQTLNQHQKPRKQAQVDSEKLRISPKIKNDIQDERDFFEIVMA
jgi:hypothetical protein